MTEQVAHRPPRGVDRRLAERRLGEAARIGDRDLLAGQIGRGLDARVGDDRRVERHRVAPHRGEPAALRGRRDHVIGTRARHVECARRRTAERLHAVAFAHQLDVEPVLLEEVHVAGDVEADERHLRRDQCESDPHRRQLGALRGPRRTGGGHRGHHTDRDERRRRGPEEGDRAERREGEPEADVDDRDDEPGEQAEHTLRVGDDPQPDDPETRDDGGDRHEGHRDDAEPGDELPVDDVVAVDRLGQQTGQRPAGSFAVDGIEAEGDADQRDEEADEAVERRELGGGGPGGRAGRSARARAIRWRCPPETSPPSSPTNVSMPSGSESSQSPAPARRSACA